MKKFFIKNFGCQINFLDSYRISNLLVLNKLIKVNNFKLCDILILNTCVVRNKPQKKIFFLNKIFN